MTARMPKAAQPVVPSSVAMLLDELEMPNTTGFVAFEEHLDARLTELEERFSDYVTRNSFAGSIGRFKGTAASPK